MRREPRVNRLLLLLLMMVAVGAGAQTPRQLPPDAFVTDSVGARDVELSPFGSFIAIYDQTEGNAIRMFDSQLRQLWRRRLPYYWSGSLDSGSILQFTPDESFVLFPAGRTEEDICVCDAQTGQPVDILQGHENNPVALALSPDGRWLVSASGDEILVWEHQDTSFVLRHQTLEFEPYVHAVEFVDNDTVAISTTLQMVRALTINRVASDGLTEVFRYQFRDNNISRDLDHIAVSPDGQVIATGYRESVFIFERDGSDIALAHHIREIDVGTVESLTFTPNGSHLVTGHFRFTKWWDRSDGWRDVATYETQQPVANDLAVSNNGNALYLASRADENAISRFALEDVGASAIGLVSQILGSGLSPAQRRVITPSFAAQVLQRVGGEAFAPRDMFETADEYSRRRDATRNAVLTEVLQAVETALGVEREETPTGDIDVSLALQDQGTYDIDRRRYDVTVFGSPAWLTIDRDAARELYRNWDSARAVATRFASSKGTSYADFRLQHPDGLSVYPLVIETNPFTGERLNPAASVLPAANVGPDLIVRELQVDGIFPALYPRYASDAFGRFTLENAGSGIVSELSASFSIDGLTQETEIQLPQSLAAGQSVPAQLVAPISSDVLSTAEGRTATLNLSIAYRRGERHSEQISRQIRVLNRNAIQWADDLRLGAFMTVSQPDVLSWAGSVAGSVTLSPTPVLTRNLLYALHLFESLAAAGIDYVIDPNSAYADVSDDRRAVDFLRFPAETLAQGAGDCDDLSVLFATLLESVGVSAAFITTPGHIFTAFDTGVSERSARLFVAQESLIILDGRLWMPIETTILVEGFVRAWQTGAFQWRQALEEGEAAIFTSREAWAEHTPVMPSLAVAVPSPNVSQTETSVAVQLNSFRELELAPKLEQLDRETGGNETPESHNRRGILYATYNLMEQAAQQFELALSEGDYVPALINQANVLSVMGRHPDARDYLERARGIDPDNARVLMGLAFSYWESGEQDRARTTYAEASRANPSLARRFPLFADTGEAGARAGLADAVYSQDWVENP